MHVYVFERTLAFPPNSLDRFKRNLEKMKKFWSPINVDDLASRPSGGYLKMVWIQEHDIRPIC